MKYEWTIDQVNLNYVYIYSLGAVKVWDPRQKNDPVATMEPGEGETKRDCWAVAFGRTFLTYHPLYMWIALTDKYYCLSIFMSELVQ